MNEAPPARHTPAEPGPSVGQLPNPFEPLDEHSHHPLPVLGRGGWLTSLLGSQRVSGRPRGGDQVAQRWVLMRTRSHVDNHTGSIPHDTPCRENGLRWGLMIAARQTPSVTGRRTHDSRIQRDARVTGADCRSCQSASGTCQWPGRATAPRRATGLPTPRLSKTAERDRTDERRPAVLRLEIAAKLPDARAVGRRLHEPDARAEGHWRALGRRELELDEGISAVTAPRSAIESNDLFVGLGLSEL